VPEGPDDPLELTAYVLDRRLDMPIVPAARRREWMEPTSASRCLPLLMANESGWFLLNPHEVRLTWDGGDGKDAITIEYPGGTPARTSIQSAFGFGIVSWEIPYLFRTAEGYNLLARGPANHPKDGIAPLEGLVETDWSPYSFTMNWRFTRPDTTVTFERHEPCCQLVPQRRAELERFAPRLEPMSADPQTAEQHHQWTESRRQLRIQKFLAEHSLAMADVAKAWQQLYFRGRFPDGTDAPVHETKRRLPGFPE
jgi:hypothetical protein